MNQNSVLWIVGAYLLGAVPWGLLLSRMKGIDIRKVGSGNIGATNVMRSVGKPWGIATFALDAVKGFVPAFAFPLWAHDPHPGFALLCAAAAILGHNFPVYLKFKGGKGVATSAGALLGLAPAAAAIGLGTWAIIFFTSRYVSLASILAAASVPVAGWLLYFKPSGWLLPSFLTVLGLLVIARHKGNIQRLINGTENRFQKKKK